MRVFELLLPWALARRGSPINHSTAARKAGGYGREDASTSWESQSCGTHLGRTNQATGVGMRIGGLLGSGLGCRKPPLQDPQLNYRGIGLPDPEPAAQASKKRKSKAI